MKHVKVLNRHRWRANCVMNRYKILLKVSHGISAGVEDVIFDIHPESHKQIDDYRRAHGEERNIDEIFADSG